MTAQQLATRAALWGEAEKNLLADLERVGVGQIDAFDLTEYHGVLEPLESALMQSIRPEEVVAGPIRAARRAIRNRAFRPTYDELAVIVRESLGMAPPQVLSGAEAAARRIVSREAAEEQFKAEMAMRIPSTGENAARTALREKMRKLRGELGQVDLRVVDGGQAETEVAA